MPDLNWQLCQGNVWCALTRVDLSRVTEEGVYIIGFVDGYYVDSVYVGQGNVRDRLTVHKGERDITQYGLGGGSLLVTWASVHANRRNGIERFLADMLQPLVGSHHPIEEPILVNIPQFWRAGPRR